MWSQRGKFRIGRLYAQPSLFGFPTAYLELRAVIKVEPSTSSGIVENPCLDEVAVFVIREPLSLNADGFTRFDPLERGLIDLN